MDQERSSLSKGIHSPVHTDLAPTLVHSETITTPPGIHIQFQEQREIDGSPLRKYSGTVNPSEQHDNSYVAEYRQPQNDIWTNIDVKDWATLQDDKNISWIILQEGLSSNHSEWDRNGCSAMETLTKKMGKNKFVVILISNPGFGGSELARSTGITTANVDDDAAARLIRGIEIAYGVPTQQRIIGGHSAGGAGAERYAGMFPDQHPRVVLFNPARTIEAGLHEHFTRLGWLNAVGKRSPDVLRSLVSRYLMDLMTVGEQASDSTPKRITKALLGKFLGVIKPQQSSSSFSSEAARDQTKMHDLETNRNYEVTQAKLASLAQNEGATRASDIPALIHVYAGTSDIVTPAAVEWFDNYFESLIQHVNELGFDIMETSPQGLIGDNKDDGGLDVFIQNLRNRLLKVQPVGHDAIFIEPDPQNEAMKMLAVQARAQKSMNNEKTERTLRTIQMLKEAGYHIQIDYQGDHYKVSPTGSQSELIRGAVSAWRNDGRTDDQIARSLIEFISMPQQLDQTSLTKRLRQMETIVTFAEVENIVRGWEKYATFEDIPPDEITNYVRTILSASDYFYPGYEFLRKNREKLPDAVKEIIPNGYEFSGETYTKAVNILMDDFDTNKDFLLDLIDTTIWDKDTTEELTAWLRDIGPVYNFLTSIRESLNRSIRRSHITGIHNSIKHIEDEGFSKINQQMLQGEQGLNVIPATTTTMIDLVELAMRNAQKKGN